MYLGQAIVAQYNLNEFLTIAQDLKVNGLMEAEPGSGHGNNATADVTGNESSEPDLVEKASEPEVMIVGGVGTQYVKPIKIELGVDHFDDSLLDIVNEGHGNNKDANQGKGNNETDPEENFYTEKISISNASNKKMNSNATNKKKRNRMSSEDLNKLGEMYETIPIDGQATSYECKKCSYRTHVLRYVRKHVKRNHINKRAKTESLNKDK